MHVLCVHYSVHVPHLYNHICLHMHIGLSEGMAWPARPQDTYGLEKLYAEEMCIAYAKDFPIKTRMARYHNVYGELSSTTYYHRVSAKTVPFILCAVFLYVLILYLYLTSFSWLRIYARKFR